MASDTRFAVALSVLGLLLCGAPGARAADSPLDQARDLADKIRGITQQRAGPPGSADTAATPQSAPTLPKGDPCSLLTDAEVRGVFPNAKSGKRERGNEQYGMSACLWDYPGGRFAAQMSNAKPGSVGQEIRGMSLGFVDPLKPAASRAVRYETLTGVGDEAMAVVEPADQQRGILSDSAMLITQRGDRQLMLSSTTLAARDRVAALKALEALGRAAANRL